MMSKKICLLATSFLLLVSGSAKGYDNWGISAAATGMGGANLATASDPSGIFYNPAGLARINQYMLYGMYNRQTTFGYNLEESPYSLAAAGALPLSQGVFGLGLAQRGSWAEETQIVTHNTVALSFARFLIPELSAGANFKFLLNTNYGDKSGLDFDLGLMYFASPYLTFGLAGENLAGTDMEPDNLTTFFLHNRRQIKLGAAYELVYGEYRTRFGFDTIFKQKKDFATETNNLNNFGIQQRIPVNSGNFLSFRAGYTAGKDYNQDFNSFAFGLSYEFQSGPNLYRFEYSYQDYPFPTDEGMAGDNRFGLTVAFGSPGHQQFGKRSDEVNLASASKAAFKKRPAKETIWDAPAETERKERLSKALVKTNPPATPPPIQNPPVESYTPSAEKHTGQISSFKVSSKIVESHSRKGKDKSYMFTFNYGLEQDMRHISEWQVLIAAEPLAKSDVSVANPKIIHVISGKGIPPSAIVWNGTNREGMRARPGEYYYAILLQTQEGGKMLSNWNSLTID
jgi:hypothetical protein